MLDVEKDINGIANWIKESVLLAKAKGVVLGLSGGVDSAVVAALCKKAFPDNTLCLIMPCYSNDKDEQDARHLAEQIQLNVQKVQLNNIYDAFLGQVRAGEKCSKQILGNVKSRLRMLTLYYFAAKLNYLVVGPTNKSEFLIGYFTKHGDSGSDIMPIADYVKEEIYKLGEQLNIPKEILEKTPTAGLWEGQTDELEMQMSYNQLDNYILNGLAKKRVMEKIESMKLNSEHKRNFPKIYKRPN